MSMSKDQAAPSTARTAELLCVGTELLLGQVLNTNARYLGVRLAALGIPVYRHTVVGDNHQRLKAALAGAAKRCSLVVLTGGLGPTDDDITREAVADHLGVPLQESAEAIQHIAAFLSRFGVELSDKNRKQALLPQGALMIPNKNGTAPGCVVDHHGVRYILLPGPPAELRTMFEDEVEPLLRAEGPLHGLESRVIRVSGIGEAQMETVIQDLVDNQTNPTVAVYAGYGETSIRLTATGSDRPDVSGRLEELQREVLARLGDHVYGSEADSLESVVLELLEARKLRLATAESCTGGALAARLVRVPGASRVFEEGAVCYSNRSKTRQLGVAPETIQQYGAVSEETAREMAQGVARVAGVEVGLAVTGVAGPDGGTVEKPVGTVYIAVAYRGKTRVRRYDLPGDREKVQRFSVSFALELLRRTLISAAP